MGLVFCVGVTIYVLVCACLVGALLVIGKWVRDRHDVTAILWLAAVLALNLAMGFVAPSIRTHAMASLHAGDPMAIENHIAAMLGGFFAACGWGVLCVLILGDCVRLLQHLSPGDKVPFHFLRRITGCRSILGATTFTLMFLSPLASIGYVWTIK